MELLGHPWVMIPCLQSPLELCQPGSSLCPVHQVSSMLLWGQHFVTLPGHMWHCQDMCDTARTRVTLPGHEWHCQDTCDTVRTRVTLSGHVWHCQGTLHKWAVNSTKPAHTVCLLWTQSHREAWQGHLPLSHYPTISLSYSPIIPLSHVQLGLGHTKFRHSCLTTALGLQEKLKKREI